MRGVDVEERRADLQNNDINSLIVRLNNVLNGILNEEKPLDKERSEIRKNLLKRLERLEILKIYDEVYDKVISFLIKFSLDFSDNTEEKGSLEAWGETVGKFFKNFADEGGKKDEFKFVALLEIVSESFNGSSEKGLMFLTSLLDFFNRLKNKTMARRYLLRAVKNVLQKILEYNVSSYYFSNKPGILNPLKEFVSKCGDSDCKVLFGKIENLLNERGGFNRDAAGRVSESDKKVLGPFLEKKFLSILGERIKEMRGTFNLKCEDQLVLDTLRENPDALWVAYQMEIAGQKPCIYKSDRRGFEIGGCVSVTNRSSDPRETCYLHNIKRYADPVDAPSVDDRVKQMASGSFKPRLITKEDIEILKRAGIKINNEWINEPRGDFFSIEQIVGVEEQYNIVQKQCTSRLPFRFSFRVDYSE